MTIPKQVRIVGDGQASFAPHLNVIDTETGKQVPMVKALTLTARVGEAPEVTLELVAPQADLSARVASIHEVCPYCGRETILVPDEAGPAEKGAP